MCLEGSSLKYAKGANIRQLHTNSTSREDGMFVLCISASRPNRVCSVTVGTVGAHSVAVVFTSELLSSHLANATFKSVHRGYTEIPYRQSYTATVSYRHEPCPFSTYSASVSACLVEVWTEPDSTLHAMAATQRNDILFARALT